ncbi:hypothetical protein KCP77_07630 [Salmonella enterica subsp. enterica]|nr:hypothetical protein KCP77_07630 [Salmonella enterica subsp. enterica]
MIFGGFCIGFARPFTGFRPSRLSFSPDFSCGHSRFSRNFTDLPQAALPGPMPMFPLATSLRHWLLYSLKEMILY